MLTPARIETSPALTLAGRNGTFPIGPSPGIKDLWASLMMDFGKIAGQVGMRSFGVCHNFDGRGHMDYVAAVQVLNAGEVPGYLFTMIIPARKEAIFTHQGPMEKLPETWELIFSVGLKAGNLNVADGPQYEAYDFDDEGQPTSIYIHIPIE
jgi:AraC family transcriptional regulator